MGLGRARSYITPSVSENGLEFPPAVGFFLPDPVREGFQSFANSAICDIVGAQEAFFRAAGASALAHRAAISRRAAGCYTGTPPPLSVSDEPLPFSGGQCSGARYRVTLRAKIVGLPEVVRGPTVFGPIESIQIESLSVGTNRRGVVIRGRTSSGDPSVNTVHSGLDDQEYEYMVIDSIERTDSGVDDCGDLPGYGPQYPPPVEPKPAPSPGQEVFPPGHLNVPVDFGGINVDVGFFYGGARIDATGNVNLNFGGIDVNISPDFGFDFGDDGASGEGFGSEPPEFPEFPDIPDYSGDFEGLGDALDSIGNKQDALDNALDSVGQGIGVLVDRVQEVKDLLSIDFDDTLQWVSCRGIEDAVGYEGIGLRGLESALKALLALVNLGSNEYCEILPSPPLVGTVTRSEFFPAQEVDNFFDVTPEPGTKAISLEIELSRPSYSVRRGSSGGEGDLQGRYGVVSFLEEVVSGDWQTMTEPVNQYYSVGLYRVPKTGNPVRIRVSVSAGSACTYRELV